MVTPQIIRKWMTASQQRVGLDILLGQAPPPTEPLRQRIHWMTQLVQWVRTVGPSATELASKSKSIQLVRLKHMIQVLDRNLSLKAQVGATLRSIIRETRALELFMHVGIPNEHGFIGEIVERLNLKFLPQPPNEQDLVSVFSAMFSRESDSEWIGMMDAEVIQSWIDLFLYLDASPGGEPPWNTLVQDARDALYLLSHAVRSFGLSRLVRNRVSETNFRKLGFFSLTDQADLLLLAKTAPECSAANLTLARSLDSCLKSLEEVYGHFRENGVNITLVYHVERIKLLIERIRTLGTLLADPKDPQLIREFFALLVQENVRVRSLRGLLADNLVLASQKIVETNAETGQHYIGRDPGESWGIFKKAAGGGVLTASTTLIKTWLYTFSLAPFVMGFFFSLNYAVSFISLQLLGFTLATKQPAMTATALASTIHEGSDSVDGLVKELVHLVRSQIITVAGNILAIIPAIFVIDLIYAAKNAHIMNVSEAEHTIASFSILGMTPFYAAWTGVLLWGSSVFSGVFDNWFSYRKLASALEHSPKLVFVFGAQRARAFAHFIKRNVAGFAANVSLGFLLGMTPQIASFFGISLEVRHVTLSSGALTAAALSLGRPVFSGSAFWLAVGGIFMMAILNLAVSFALALTVAIWAKKNLFPKRLRMYREILKKILQKPWVFVSF